MGAAHGRPGHSNRAQPEWARFPRHPEGPCASRTACALHGLGPAGAVRLNDLGKPLIVFEVLIALIEPSSAIGHIDSSLFAHRGPHRNEIEQPPPPSSFLSRLLTK